MVGQNRLIGTALGKSILGSKALNLNVVLRGSGLAIAIALLANAAPAFSQVSALDRLLEQAELSDVAESSDADKPTATEQIAIEQAVIERQLDTEPSVSNSAMESVEDAAESEAAILMLTEALAADGVTDLFVSAEAEALTAKTKRPGAEALSGLESVSIESFSIERATGSNGRDLLAAGDTFTVDAASVPALRAALGSDQALAQLYAADALWTLTGDSNLVLPTLMEAAASDDADIQELAVLALKQMGDEASPAVPVLVELLDKDSKTRLIAQDALTVINSENRSEAVLGIIARESQRRLLPAALRAIGGLWR